jgi:hypothetical protein
LLTLAEYVFKFETEILTDAEVVSKFVNLGAIDEVNEFKEVFALLAVNEFILVTEMLTLAEVVSKFVNLRADDAVYEFNEPVPDDNPVNVSDDNVEVTVPFPSTNLIEALATYKCLQGFVVVPKSNVLPVDGINEPEIPPLILSS